MQAKEARHRLRQVLGQRGRVGENADAGAQATRKTEQIALHRLDLAQHQPRVLQQAFAGRCRRDAASLARQQGNTAAASSPLMRSLADASAR